MQGGRVYLDTKMFTLFDTAINNIMFKHRSTIRRLQYGQGKQDEPRLPKPKMSWKESGQADMAAETNKMIHKNVPRKSSKEAFFRL